MALNIFTVLLHWDAMLISLDMTPTMVFIPLLVVGVSCFAGTELGMWHSTEHKALEH